MIPIDAGQTEFNRKDTTMRHVIVISETCGTYWLVKNSILSLTTYA
jgi:hypothetical protein